MGMTNVALALDPIDISPAFHDFSSSRSLSNGAEWSGLTISNFTGNLRLYAIDGGGTQTLKQMDLAGNETDRSTITGISDPEGLTHVSGSTFAMLDEASGNIYLFNMTTALSGNAFNIANNNLGVIPTGLDDANDGPEGIAYDPVSDGFYVAKEKGSGRGIYWVENTTSSPQVNFELDPFAHLGPDVGDLSGLFLAGQYLYVVSDQLHEVFRYRITSSGLSSDPQSLDLDIQLGDGGNFEGIAIHPDGRTIFLVGDGSAQEFRSYTLPMNKYDFDADGEFTADDIDLLIDAIGGSDLSFDFDGDSDVDFDDLDYYVKDFLFTYYGDANLDREYNSADLVLVFQAGRYENGPAGWAEGDWNGDQEFTSADFVTAFQDGGYDQGPRL
jgi:uncharacterized protein YjiK